MSSRFLPDLTITIKDVIILLGLIIPGVFYCANMSSKQDQIIRQQAEIVQRLNHSDAQDDQVSERVADINNRVYVLRNDVDNIITGKINIVR